ncbi:hypothetical protein HAZT_HAZT002198 [Hyalella azteca]|uniref:FAD dependent oxidoreductase domain-containing protein n=1 Tax=Hyalella azteca TaxID=294128 RepID=A0A6A0H2A0_HYAAZ|nr:hypothetical protein HAZT_HAZT002198 [Hyalella azteca]
MMKIIIRLRIYLNVFSRRWLRDSYDYYKEILDSPEAEAAGIKSLAVTVLSTEHEKIVKNAFLEGLLPDYRFMTSEELGQFQGGPYIYGCRFTTMLTDCSKFLPYLMAKFRDRGGKIIKQRVASFNELAPHFDVVVNCCGLVAGDMCGDSTITPIRGQVYKVKAPWITEGFYSDYDTYILPGPEYVTLGGCRQFDSYNTEIDVHDSKSIWERCLRLMPSLRDAQVTLAMQCQHLFDGLVNCRCSADKICFMLC